jgi:replicative DNA helicase
MSAVAGKAEWIIAKNRSGSTGTIDMGWEGSRTRFLELQDQAHG